MGFVNSRFIRFVGGSLESPEALWDMRFVIRSGFNRVFWSLSVILAWMVTFLLSHITVHCFSGESMTSKEMKRKIYRTVRTRRYTTALAWVFSRNLIDFKLHLKYEFKPKLPNKRASTWITPRRSIHKLTSEPPKSSHCSTHLNSTTTQNTCSRQ